VKTTTCGKRDLKYFTQCRRNKENVSKTKPAIKRIFILPHNLPLDMTEVVKTLGYAPMLSSKIRKYTNHIMTS